MKAEIINLDCDAEFVEVLLTPESLEEASQLVRMALRTRETTVMASRTPAISASVALRLPPSLRSAWVVRSKLSQG